MFAERLQISIKYGIINSRGVSWSWPQNQNWIEIIMFESFFIKKHKKDVSNYIQAVFEYPSEIRYALPVEVTVPDEQSTEFASTSECQPTGHIMYSERGTPSDEFDPQLVARAMGSYLHNYTSVRPLSSATNLTFVQKLTWYIRNKNLIEADVYKAALMDRRLFSKIICNDNYKPSKDTALALIFALRLSLSEAMDMLERAGYTLSHSIQRDIIIEYFIKEKVYNLNNINAFLYNMGEKTIGRNA